MLCLIPAVDQCEVAEHAFQGVMTRIYRPDMSGNKEQLLLLPPG